MELFFGLSAAVLNLDVVALFVVFVFLLVARLFDTEDFDAAFFVGCFLTVARPRALVFAPAFLTAGALVEDLVVAFDVVAFLPAPFDVPLVTFFFAVTLAFVADFFAAGFLAVSTPCAFLLGATVLLAMLELSVLPGPPGRLHSGKAGSPWHSRRCGLAPGASFDIADLPV